jgi:hypothetical protein
MDIYGTHLPALMAAVANSNGPILEFGCGYYSTLVLHEYCRTAKRRLVSAETDLDWLLRFSDMIEDWHEFYHVHDWDDFHSDVVSKNTWGTVFIDHKPGERRATDLRLVRDLAEFVVVHDTETDFNTGADYKYEPAFKLYKYRVDYRRVRPYTTVVSQTREIELDQSLWQNLPGCS